MHGGARRITGGGYLGFPEDNKIWQNEWVTWNLLAVMISFNHIIHEVHSVG